ncbi:hypothetical protein BH11PSE2_BH11PSE2_08600 [soil metagenome]
MQHLTFVVSQRQEGWYVQGCSALGPMHTRQQAIDLAEGMALVVARSGMESHVELEETAAAAGYITGDFCDRLRSRDGILNRLRARG